MQLYDYTYHYKSIYQYQIIYNYQKIYYANIFWSAYYNCYQDCDHHHEQILLALNEACNFQDYIFYFSFSLLLPLLIFSISLRESIRLIVLL